MKLTKLSIERGTIVVVIFAILTTLGSFSYSKLGYELLPSIAPPVLTMVTVYPGASPKEVENSVTKKIEDAASSLENIKKISSKSKENISIVSIEFNYGTNIDIILQDAQQKVNSIKNDLPDDCQETMLSKWSVDDMPIISMGVSGNLSSTELYDLVKNRIKPSLSQLKGVAKIDMKGGTNREIQVNINQNKIEGYGLSIMEVTQAIQKANMDIPSGKIKSSEGQKLIRLAGKIENVDQLNNIIVRQKANGSLIRLRDIADISDAAEDRNIVVRNSHNNAMGLLILKQSDANAVEVSHLVKERLSKLETLYQKDKLKFDIASDTTDFTIESANSVMHDLLLAIILVAVVMILFLQSFRNSIIVMISVPASMISTFIVMYMAGFTLNMMTLLGLSLVVGILVDDAIVVIENIHRHMEMGKNRVQASFDAIKEIGLTVASITLVIVIVFIPLAMTSGITGDLFRQFSIVVSISTLLSLFVAFTLIPMLSARFSKMEHINPKSIFGKLINGFEGFINKCIDAIVSLLRWSLKHKAITLALTIILFISSLALIVTGFIGAEFAASGDRGEFVLTVELPKSATIEQSNTKVLQVEDYLYKQAEVKNVFSIIGSSSSAQEGEFTPYKSELRVLLKDAKFVNRSDGQLARDYMIALQELIPGVKIETSTLNIMGMANSSPIKIPLYGPDFGELMQYAEKVKKTAESIPGTTQVKLSIEEGSPELNVKLDRDKLSALELNLANVGASLRTAFNGNNDLKFKDGNEEYNINIRFDQFDRNNSDNMKNMTFINNKGEKIKLKEFATVTETIGPSQLERQDRITCVTVQSGVIGRPSGTVGNEIIEKLSTVDKPEEIVIGTGGDMEMQKESMSSLLLAFIASILFVYLIMVALYDSYIYPMVVLFSIPLAIIGALLALALARQTLNIFSLLGIIMLIGLVAKNAILLVDFALSQKKQGVPIAEALIEATRTRFRPIVMTTLAMVFGMLPIALASGAGAEWKNGLAWALIGGLSSSLVLTMVVVPVVFYIFERILQKLGLSNKKNPVIKSE
ncbi:MAG: efflux RND transporter permease subunit [Bacteroidales bacterium]